MSAESLKDLSPDQKRALLKRLLAERAETAPGDYPPTPGQQAIWFLQKFLPDTAAYNVAFAAHVAPPLELPALERAFTQLAARHASLRTVFPEQDGRPIQRVLPPSAVPIHVAHVPDLSDAELDAMVRRDYGRPFVLDEPLMTVFLYRRQNEDVLLLNVHHLIFDAWSLQILFEELEALYRAELAGEPIALTPPAAQYRDFAAWQNRLTQDSEGERLWSYWATTLTPPLPVLNILAAKPRPAELELRGGTIPFALDRQLSNRLQELARERHTTLYTVFLAALQVLLYQFSEQTDFVVGTPVSLRTRDEWRNVIGYFINMVPIRTTVDPTCSFLDHLESARQAALGALAHQEFPFPLMVDRLKIRRETNRSPVFQAMLNVVISGRAGERPGPLTAGPSDPIRFGPSQLLPYPLPQQEGQFEIVLEVTDAGGALLGNLKYQTDLYTEETARQMSASYLAILERIVTDPAIRIEDLVKVERDTFEI